MVGREDGGREVVAVDEDLSNFAKSEAPMCGVTQPQPNKCKQWATFQVLADHNPVRRLRRIDHTPSHLDYYRLGVWLLLRLSVPSLPCLRGAQLSTTTLSRPLATISSGSVPIANRHLLAAVLIRCSSQQA